MPDRDRRRHDRRRRRRHLRANGSSRSCCPTLLAIDRPGHAGQRAGAGDGVDGPDARRRNAAPATVRLRPARPLRTARLRGYPVRTGRSKKTPREQSSVVISLTNESVHRGRPEGARAPEKETPMSDYAVVNPATGETVKTYPTITDDELDAAIAGADEAHRTWSRSHDRRRARRPHPPGRRTAPRAPPGAGRDHRARDGQADRAGARRGRLLRRHLRVLRRQRRRPAEGRADQAARRRGLGAHPPQLARRAAGHHAVELPVLPGRPLRRPQPDHRQHHPAQARAAVPGVRRGDRADLPRRRLPRGRLRQHLRDPRPDRDASSPTRACRASR